MSRKIDLLISDFDFSVLTFVLSRSMEEGRCLLDTVPENVLHPSVYEDIKKFLDSARKLLHLLGDSSDYVLTPEEKADV